ncbi:uncharacterized protein LOC129971950 [Argiope bruennichi]|uniref:uncharacterized protein LOC129971950 n=1 Tax=Argiope bruennichi TaxID=94029 RepID=UPI002493FEAC|nr:uncharacterized protein LOC129971950 [Argiope bruennichi]
MNHLEENKECFPETSEILKNSFYVDNCVTSVRNEDDLTRFIQEAKLLLSRACFDLRSWEYTRDLSRDEPTVPTSGRKTVQKVLSRCIRCKRYTSKKIESIPAPLPEDRVRETLIFEVTGVDLAGPLHLKDGEKAWILLFTCAVYRAIHLELIQSLSTNRFLLGFRRFVARRGRTRTIYSDNGTNFTGTNNLMGSLDWDKIVNDASVLRIQWKFNPPTAAWWGGFFESMIKMVKKLLRRVLGKASLHYEEMFTILCDVEANINSRPLNYLSEDPNDLIPLTPSMFIQETTKVGVPDLDTLDKKKPKGKESRQVEVGDIVIIESDIKKRLDWPLGLVIEVFTGKDGCIRVVKLKTASGELVRPVQRLYPLELDNDDPRFSSKVSKYVVHELKGALLKTEDWCIRWRVSINTEKAHAILFRKG